MQDNSIKIWHQLRVGKHKLYTFSWQSSFHPKRYTKPCGRDLTLLESHASVTESSYSITGYAFLLFFCRLWELWDTGKVGNW